MHAETCYHDGALEVDLRTLKPFLKARATLINGPKHMPLARLKATPGIIILISALVDHRKRIRVRRLAYSPVAGSCSCGARSSAYASYVIFLAIRIFSTVQI